MDRLPPRTLLDQIIRRSRRTIEENCAAFEGTAREANEDVALSQRQLSRWLSGRVRLARPAGQRVAEIHWGYPFETLLGPPVEDAGAVARLPGWTKPGGAPGGESSGDAGEPNPIAGGEAGLRPAGDLFLELLGQRAVAVSSGQPAAPGGTMPAGTLHEIDFDELVKGLVMWLRQVNPAVGRRDVLGKLGAAVALAGAGPLFDLVDPEERERVTRVLHDPARVDAATLGRYASIVTGLRRQDNVLGPRTTMPAILAYRDLVRGLVGAAPPELRPLAQSLHAELSQLAGWSLFNLGDHQNALYYYEDARTAAHDAHNVDLVTYVLCDMSMLATERGKPRIGIDHAAAAATWAGQIDSPHARVFAANVAVLAYSADRQQEKCQGALAHEYAALREIQELDGDAPVSPWWYFCDESFYWRTEARYALSFKRPDAALHAIDKSFDLNDPAHLHQHTHLLLYRAEAYIQKAEVAEASTIIGDVASLPLSLSNQRFDKSIRTLRGALTPWEASAPVRELDERLASCSGS